MSNAVLGNIQHAGGREKTSAATSVRLISKNASRQIRIIPVAVDFAIIVGLVWLNTRLPGLTVAHEDMKVAHHWREILFALLPLNVWFGTYSRLKLSVFDHLWRSVAAAICLLAASGILAQAVRLPDLRQLAVSCIAFVLISVFLRRIGCAWHAHYVLNPFRTEYIVAFGNGSLIEQLAPLFKPTEERRANLVATFTAEGRSCSDTNAAPVSRRDVSELLSYLGHNPADTVLIALPRRELLEMQEVVRSILEIGLKVGVLPESFDEALIAGGRGVTVTDGFMGVQMKVLSTVSQSGLYLVSKRVLDITIAAIALVILLPAFLLIAGLVKITSEGPVFYPWKVLGRNRKPFTGYKFRTMVRNADEIKSDLMVFNEMTGPVFKMRNDPRITPIGRWLRKFSLDEFPQLYSVLKGDMSLVGPRPP